MMAPETRNKAALARVDGPWQLDCFQHGVKIFSHSNVFLLLNGAGKVIGYQNTGTGLRLSLPVEPPIKGEHSVLQPAPHPSVACIWQRK